MQDKWRLLILLAYIAFLVPQIAGTTASGWGFEVFSGDTVFLLLFLLFALAPVAILCLTPKHEPAMGIAASVVAAFGVWAYNANGGDPIGLAIIIFYQFCIMGIGALAIVIGASFLEKKS